MADIKIKKISSNGNYSEETTVEIIGADYIHEELIKNIIGRAEQSTAPECETADGSPEGTVGLLGTFKPQSLLSPCNMRALRSQHITPTILKAAINQEKLDSILQPFDEIDIPLDTGGTVTVMCAYVEPEWARFVFKDCWDKGAMKDEATNKTGYFKSKGRAHVLVHILPHIAQEWRAIFKSRQMVEEIDGERMEYADLMWLPSATDVFGPSEDGCWKDIDDSFQLPIFKRARDRVKECGDEGTYPYWLRSVNATNSNNFRLVNTGGSGGNRYACYSLGFAPGFDIANVRETGRLKEDERAEAIQAALEFAESI